jgi:hypothetical protein
VCYRGCIHFSSSFPVVNRLVAAYTVLYTNHFLTIHTSDRLQLNLDHPVPAGCHLDESPRIMMGQKGVRARIIKECFPFSLLVPFFESFRSSIIKIYARVLIITKLGKFVWSAGEIITKI